MSAPFAALAGAAALVLVCRIAAPGTAAAATASCPPAAKAARVTVTGETGSVILKSGHGRADLMRLQRAGPGTAKGAGWLPMGLTRTDLKFNIRTEAELAAIGPGRYCARPTWFAIDVGFSDFLIYIDRRYRPGSCEYRVIGEHENKHVALYRGHLERFVPSLRRTAERAVAGLRPIVVSAPDDGPKRLQQALQRIIDPLLKRFEREADAANAAIDTERSYLATQALCDNW